MSEQRYVSTGAAARVLGLSRQAITRRAELGQIPGALKTGPGRSHWRIPAEYGRSLRSAVAPVVRRR